MGKKLNVIFILLILGVLTAIIRLKHTATSKPSKVKTIRPVIKTIVNKRYISGVLLPSKEIVLNSRISGIVEEVFVNTGDAVQKYDSVAIIKLIPDPENLEASDKASKLTELNLKSAKIKYERNLHLYEKGLIALEKFEEYRDAFLVAQQEYESAQRQQQIIQEGYAEGLKEISNAVTSTISGVVMEMKLKKGSSVIERNNFSEGTEIATIADMDNVVFSGKISERDIQYLSEGMQLNISVNAIDNLYVTGKIISIAPKGIIENGITKFDFECSVKLDKKKRSLIRSGYTAVGEVVLEKAEEVLAIEERLLNFKGDSAFIKIYADNQIKRQHVQLGISDGIYIQVDKGLTVDNDIVDEF